jgi:hypothetical protein
MTGKKLYLTIFLSLILVTVITNRAASQQHAPSPFHRPPEPAPPGYYPPVVPPVVPKAPVPKVIPWGKFISLQFAMGYFKPLTITFVEFFQRPSYYYGKYITWKGVIVNDQPARYLVNIPNESAFYFKVVNPNLKSKKWLRNQTVTVVGIPGSDGRFANAPGNS